MDALHAAPASHRLLLDNDRVRVLDVVIEPGTREPEHTHQAASVMIIDEPARIRYYQGDALLFESRARPETQPGARVRWMEPEGPHSVENIDEHRYLGTGRFEAGGGPAARDGEGCRRAVAAGSHRGCRANQSHGQTAAARLPSRRASN